MLVVSTGWLAYDRFKRAISFSDDADERAIDCLEFLIPIPIDFDQSQVSDSDETKS